MIREISNVDFDGLIVVQERICYLLRKNIGYGERLRCNE